MLFGHNTNVSVDGTVLHVQTEDRGINSATLDTTVHCRGRVLHRRTNKYHDLLPLDEEKEKSLKARLDEQHFGVVEELKSGALKVEVPQAPPPRTAPASAPASSIASIGRAASSPAIAQANSAKVLTVEMLNPRTWLSGKHATLYLVVRSKDGGTPIAAARVVATVAGASEPTAVEIESSADGHAKLEFDMPKLISEDAALVIEASTREAQGHLRFALRAKPKAPAAS
jgi:hypothetical protein